MDFATQLRAMRAARNMSQGELAVKVGVQRHVITYLEKGLAVPSESVEAKIRLALDWPKRADGAFVLQPAEPAAMVA